MDYCCCLGSWFIIQEGVHLAPIVLALSFSFFSVITFLLYFLTFLGFTQQARITHIFTVLGMKPRALCMQASALKVIL
jgi:hypothetical protein